MMVRRVAFAVPPALMLALAVAVVTMTAEAGSSDCTRACKCQASCEEKLAVCNETCSKKETPEQAAKCKYDCLQRVAKCVKNCRVGDCDCGGY